VLKSHPEYPDVHYRLGQIAEHKGQDREAIMRYRQALTLNERYREPRLALGLCLRKIGRFDEAVRHFVHIADTGVELPRDWTEGVPSEDPPATVEAVRREVGEVRNSRAFVAEGIRSYHDGDLAAALEQFTKAVEQVPNHPDLRCRKATVLGELGRMGEAIDELSVALELNPSYEEARLKRGVARLQLGLFLDAAEDFDRVLKNGPSNDELELLHGIALLKGGQAEVAVTHLSTATLSGNTAIRAAYFLAQAHVALNRHERAVAVLEAHPSPSNRVLQGKLLIEMGNFAQAAEVLETALDQGERTPAVYLCLAQARFHNGDGATALAHAKFALSDPSTSDDAAYLLARLAFEGGNDEQALHWLSKHSAGLLTYPVLVLRGRVLDHLRRHEEAKAVLEKALEIEPGGDDAQRALGLLLQRMGLPPVDEASKLKGPWRGAA
jgi:tetratricopeptide (TPR) repeat protein